MQEFEIIAKYFAPLASNFPGALGLKDDAAIIGDLVITKDAIKESIHFLSNTDPYLIAKKLLRTNLSDLAAMGAVPIAYLMAISSNNQCDESWFERFSKSLAEDNQEFHISLIGGDSIRSNEGIFCSLTAIGKMKDGKLLRRNAAKIGDDIYVTGTIGDASLGLMVTKNELEYNEFLLRRYNIPIPRLKESQVILPYANACIDISDGLFADLAHICEASNCGADINIAQIPLSDSAKPYQHKYMENIITGGDDYELLFTAPPIHAEKLADVATKIGKITEAQIRFFQDHKQVYFSQKGFVHGFS